MRIFRIPCLVWSQAFSTKMQSIPRQLGDTKPLRVRDVQDESNCLLEISFEFDGKMRQFSRKKFDNLESTLKRIAINVLNPKKKKQKKSKQQEESIATATQEQNMVIELRESDNKTIVSPTIENCKAWIAGRKLLLKDTFYTIFENPPSVTVLALPDNIMAGFPVFPFVKFEFAKKSSSSFRWYASTGEENTLRLGEAQGTEASSVTTAWKYVGNGFNFTPPISLVGSYLKISCIPANGEIEGLFSYEFVSKVAVSPSPGLCPFEERQIYTQRRVEGDSNFRIVCYNILADIYASGEFARTVLFPYCPDYAIDYHYRRQLMLKELLGYNSDLICLQECDAKCFDGYLTPALEAEGFKGAFRFKGQETSEGEAIWYRRSRFSFVKDYSMTIKDGLASEPCKNILTALEKVPNLLENFNKRKTIVQIIILKDNDNDRYTCVANTHLYYKPSGGHIRLLQTAVILKQLQNITENAKEELNVDSIDIILCGDLNSTPQSAAIDYILNKTILPQNLVWFPEELSEHGFSMTLEHDITLTSACGFPKFTNYVCRFKATLDYIMISSSFHVLGVVPFPTEDSLQLHQALPSVVSPSDHLALVCDVQWKK